MQCHTPVTAAPPQAIPPPLSLSLDNSEDKANLNFDGAQKTSQVDMRSCSATAARGWGTSPARVLAAPRLLRHGPLHISLPAEAAKGGAGRGSKPARAGQAGAPKLQRAGGGGGKARWVPEESPHPSLDGAGAGRNPATHHFEPVSNNWICECEGNNQLAPQHAVPQTRTLE